MINFAFCEFNNRSTGQKISDSKKERAGAEAAGKRAPKQGSLKAYKGNGL